MERKIHLSRFIVFLGVLFSVLAIIMLPSLRVEAEVAPAPDIPYSVTPVFNESQIDKSVSYFDLLVKPGETETVEINVSNHSDKEIVVLIRPNTAKTTSNGTIDYSGMSLKSSKNLVASFDEIVSGEQRVKIPAKSTKKVPFSITVPNQSFKGILLGGFYIQEEKNGSEEDANQSDVAIKNEFSFIIGCQLKMNDEPVQKKFSLDSVKVDTYGGYFSVVSNIVNDEPALVSSFSLEGQINDKNGKEIYQLKKKSFSMAPNSIFSLPERIKQTTLKAGEYTMDMKITSKNGKKTWRISKPFTVSAKERDAAIKESIEKPEKTNILLYVAMGVIILLLIILIITVNKKKK